MVVACLLLEAFHERLEVCGFRLSSQDEMQMIRHEAVGKNCQIELSRGVKKLLVRNADARAVGEETLAPGRARGDEIAEVARLAGVPACLLRRT
jgi:hypothetical protein